MVELIPQCTAPGNFYRKRGLEMQQNESQIIDYKELLEAAKTLKRERWCASPAVINASNVIEDYILAVVKQDDDISADLEWWLTFCNNKELGFHFIRDNLWLHLFGMNGDIRLCIDNETDAILVACNPTRGQVRRIAKSMETI